MRFDVYPKRQVATESFNINSLADHLIWSTIKTLPATSPEQSFTDHGPRTRVTEAVSASGLDFCEGIGRRARAVVRRSRTLTIQLVDRKMLMRQLQKNSSLIVSICFSSSKYQIQKTRTVCTNALSTNP